MPEMDNATFANWLAGIGLLNPTQRGQTYHALALVEANDPFECRDNTIDAGSPGDVPEAAPRHVIEKTVSATEPPPVKAEGQSLLSKVGQDRIANFGCPHCGGDGVHRWGSASGKPRYRCTSCRKTFNPVTGTPLAGLHHPDRWNDQAAALISGESLALAAKRCDVHPSTAFRWRHRFLAALNLDKPPSLSGLVEADETFILESFKGKRTDLPRKSRKRGGKASKRGLSTEQIPVIVARDRTGATIDAVLPRLDAASMIAALGNTITRPAELCCDGGSAITAFARRARIKFHILPAPGLPKPEAPDIHINNVNAYHGRLKEWMRHFHGVATRNLPSYLSWRRTIEALGGGSTPEAWIMGAAGMGPYLQASL
jgi:transposase-like protein